MTLNCRNTNEALHQHGKQSIKTFVTSPLNSDVYKIPDRPEDEPKIPAPDIFEEKNESNLNSNSTTRLPTVTECAIHLELLETFFVLRERIIRSTDIDRSMDIAPNRETKTGRKKDTKTLKDKTLGSRRQAKWTKYVEFAVARFLAWRTKLGKKHPNPTVIDGITKPFDGPLPPLDVLMVWHAFLLNPILYNHTCRREHLYLAFEFPWHAVHARINNSDWTFTSRPDDDHTFPPLFDVFATWREDYTAACKPRLATFSLDFTPSTTTLDKLAPSSQIRRHADAIRAIDDIPLATALRDAVIRQTSFVDKMNNHLWIRSPALEGTLRRAVDRYGKFLVLLKREAPRADANGGNSSTIRAEPIIVPTLDIDLVWHTHQGAGYRYVLATRALVGRFVDHNDKIGTPTLEDGASKSRRLFRLHFGEEYRRCSCWDCEALLSELEDPVGLAAAVGEDGELDMAVVAKRVKQKVEFHRAVEGLRRRGVGLPLLRD